MRTYSACWFAWLAGQLCLLRPSLTLLLFGAVADNANQTNIYTVGTGHQAEEYTPRFAGGGLRYAQLSGLPAGVTPSLSWLSGLKINSNVSSVSSLHLPVVPGRGSGTPDVLNTIHGMVLASQSSNLWSVPTDCPQRERRGWTGAATQSSDLMCTLIAQHRMDALLGIPLAGTAEYICRVVLCCVQATRRPQARRRC